MLKDSGLSCPLDPKQIKNEVVRWIASYFNSTATRDTLAVVGISGGKDSTVTAALCAEAIGKERVVGVIIPNGRQEDINVTYAVCEHLGIPYTEINIGNCIESLYSAMIIGSDIELNDTAKFNTPARIRMATLYAFASSYNGRVANCCNYSEAYIGWGTKYGDMAGDFSPISDLTASEVKQLGYQLGLPAEFVEKPPADGLCGKTDEESFGFTYDVLDKYIRTGVCDDFRIKAKIDKMNAASEHKRRPMLAYRKNIYSYMV